MGVKITRVNHIMVSVGDIEVAKEFYGILLDLEEIEIPAEITGNRLWYKLGDIVLHVNQHSDHKAGLQHFGLEVESGQFGAYFDRIDESDYTKYSKPEKHVDGIIRFFIHDPFGNAIEISNA